jgi:hypothetical protein
MGDLDLTNKTEQNKTNALASEIDMKAMSKNHPTILVQI